MAGEVVAEAGGSQLGDAEAAGGDDEGFGGELAFGAFDVEAGGVVLDADAVGVVDEIG